jgi:hypothetical protein
MKKNDEWSKLNDGPRRKIKNDGSDKTKDKTQETKTKDKTVSPQIRSVDIDRHILRGGADGDGGGG